MLQVDVGRLARAAFLLAMSDTLVARWRVKIWVGSGLLCPPLCDLSARFLVLFRNGADDETDISTEPRSLHDLGWFWLRF